LHHFAPFASVNLPADVLQGKNDDSNADIAADQAPSEKFSYRLESHNGVGQISSGTD